MRKGSFGYWKLFRNRKEENYMKKKIMSLIMLVCIAVSLVGCTTADTVNYNLTKDANEFNLYRKITVTNARTDTTITVSLATARISFESASFLMN